LSIGIIIVFFIWLPLALSIRLKVRESSVRAFNEPKGKAPPTPEPNYICANCGMLIENGHGHTRRECEQYESSGYAPDYRAMKTIMPSRNEPEICLPNYYED
jgi:hypothetical protein